MNAHDLIKVWDAAIEDALRRVVREENPDLCQVSGLELKSDLGAGNVGMQVSGHFGNTCAWECASRG